MTHAHVPDDNDKERVLAIMEEWYKPCRWILPDDWFSYDRFLTVLKRLDKTSSPGYPYCKYRQTIGDWLGFDGFNFDPVQVQTLWMDVQQVYNGEAPPMIQRVFIKQEPHKKAKAEEGRWRLIMAFPLSYQVFWHLLFDYQNDLEIEKATEIPSQQGIWLHGGAWKGHLARWKQKGYDTGLDKSAWDWTFMWWLMLWELEFRHRSGHGREMDNWLRHAKRMYEMAFGKGALLVTTDGYILEQQIPGIMKSGSVNTISSNSHAQVLLHILVCLIAGVDFYPFPACCGDDTLQRMIQALIAIYLMLGVVVKSASEGLEFMGHEFLDTGPSPLYLEKHLNRFVHIDEEYVPEYIESMARLYVKTPYFYLWEDLSMDFGCLLPSKQALERWYDVSD